MLTARQYKRAHELRAEAKARREALKARKEELKAQMAALDTQAAEAEEDEGLILDALKDALAEYERVNNR